jgi:hypothetical protein
MASGFRNKIDELSSSFGRLSSRERVMVGALGISVLLFATFGAGYWIYSGLQELEEGNTATRKALNTITENESEFVASRKRQASFETLMSRDPLELNTYVEKTASAVGIGIVRSDEAKPVAQDRFVQRGLDIKLRKVTVAQLAEFLSKLEANRTHIVQVSELSVHTRWQQHKENMELDVDLTVTTFDRKVEKEGGREPTKGRSKTRRRGRT